MITRGIKATLLGALKNISKKQNSQAKKDYVDQPTISGCGPTALFNLLQWADYDVSLDQHYALLRNLSKTEDVDPCGEFGCWPHDLDQSLKDLCQSLKDLTFKGCKYQPTVEELLQESHRGNAIILHYRHLRPNDSHYVFIPSHHSKKNIPVINDAHPSLTQSQLKLLLSRKAPNAREVDLEIDRIYPKAWVIGLRH